jgi:hypothetical protein
MLETIILAAVGIAVLALLARHFLGMIRGRKTGCWCGEPCEAADPSGRGRSCPAREICPVPPPTAPPGTEEERRERPSAAE